MAHDTCQAAADQQVAYTSHTIPVRLQPINRSPTLGTQYVSGCSRSTGRPLLSLYPSSAEVDSHDASGTKSSKGAPRLSVHTHVTQEPLERLFVTFNNDECAKMYRYLSRYSYSLRGLRSEDRIPVWLRLSATAQTGPGAHPASCTIGTGSFPGVKWPGLGVNRTPPSRPEIKERIMLCLYAPSGPACPLLR